MDQKLAEKLKEAKSAKELSIAAHEAGVNISDTAADKYFAELHSREHELSNEELNNVSGGSCDSEKELEKKYEKVNPSYVCDKHTWTYWAYSGVASLILIMKKGCDNCHYSINSDGPLLYCEMKPKA
jgi:bacteriocin-like protein